MVAMLTAISEPQKVSQSSDLPFVLARHRSQDCYFDIKLTQLESTTFQGRPAHQLHLKLDLARPFDVAKRIRSATVFIDVIKSKKARKSPKIVGIDPEASLVHMADHEITNGQNYGMSAGTPATAPAAISANINLTRGDKTTYQGNRLIHGFMPSSTEAQWKLYEEPKSKSGLPPSLLLLMIVESKEDFWVNGEVRVQRWGGWCGMGMVQSLQAPMADEKMKFFPVQGVSSGSLRAVHKISDDIAATLKESEQKLESLEIVINKQFPKLRREVIYKGCGAVLRLSPHISISKVQQFNIPFYPDIRRVSLQTDSPKTSRTGTKGLTGSRQRTYQADVTCDRTGEMWISDIRSAFGTFINGERLVPGREYRLRQNDRLQFKAYHTDRTYMRVEYAGIPEVTGTSSGKEPDLELDLNSLRQHPKIDGEDAPSVKAQKVRKDVEDKFESWKIMANKDDLGSLNLLHELTNKRLENLGIPPTDIGYDEDFEDGESDIALTQRFEGRSSLRDRRRSSRRDHYSSPKHGSGRTGGGQLFSGRTMSGEEALRKHETVGGGWKETKLQPQCGR